VSTCSSVDGNQKHLFLSCHERKRWLLKTWKQKQETRRKRKRLPAASWPAIRINFDAPAFTVSLSATQHSNTRVHTFTTPNKTRRNYWQCQKKQKLKQLPLLSRASLHGNVLRVAKKEITENNRPFAWKKNHQTIRSTTTTHWIYFSFLFQRKANKTPVVVQGNAALVSRIAKSDTETCVTRPKSTGELTWCAGSPEMLPPMTLWYWWMAEAPPPYSTTGTVEPIRRQFHQFR